jgi:formylglycine-generating enzyme required for sulfatase activity
VESIPAGAQVHIDGNQVGQTPLSFDLSAGTHRILIRAERHKPWQSELTVSPGEPVTLKDIRLEPADGRLTLTSKPAGANVIVDGSYAGQTPLEIDLAADKSHALQLSKAGYQTVRRSVTLGSTAAEKLEIQLPPMTGTVALRVIPPKAELWIDGRRYGPVPETLQLIAVEHALEIRKEGYTPFVIRITPRPGFPQEVDVALQKKGTPGGTAAAIVTAGGGYPLHLVKPATFTMGASRREQGRRSNETLRKVQFSRPFYMGAREVTNAEFRQFLAEHRAGAFKDLSLDKPEQPVVGVTWEQAALFCNWLSLRDSLPPAYTREGGRLVSANPMGPGYRLPTEAEWEYCARYREGKAELKYPWGDTYPPPDRAGNFADESAKDLLAVIINGYKDGHAVSAPVGQYRANALGLYDMGGNVAEWCHDFYGIYRYDADKVAVDPNGPREGKHRVVRDSSWKQAGIGTLRLAFRDYSADQRQDLGFRICRYLN